MKQLLVTDPRYTHEDVFSLVGVVAEQFERSITGMLYQFSDSVQDSAIQAAQDSIAAGSGIYEFRGVRVRSNADVDNVVSEAIKEAIAPGRPANLQGEAEKALLAKISALTAKAALGVALSAEEQAYLQEKLTFYANVVQPIREEGDAFNAARGW